MGVRTDAMRQGADFAPRSESYRRFRRTGALVTIRRTP